MSRLKLPSAILSCAPLLLFGALPANSEGAWVIGDYSAWSLYQSRGANHHICYVASQPVIKLPATANRAAIVLYISAWPADGVRGQFSVKFGYPVDPKNGVTVTIGEDTFLLTPKDERAYIYDTTEELKLIEAMKLGSTMVVTAVSTRGTKTTDTYSLSGITSALDAMAETCS